MAKASNVKVGIQSGTSRTVYATWDWSKTNTKEYSVAWYYATGDGVWFVGEKTTVTVKQSVYTAPDNATKVKFRIRPVSKTYKVKNKDTSYWTADWTSESYNFSNNPPVTPSVPTVTIEKYNLTAEVDDYNSTNTSIEFYIVKDDRTVFSRGIVGKIKNYAAITCTVNAGSVYKVRCRGVKNDADTLNKGDYSEWSEYSDNVATIPAAVSGITSCKALSDTSVRVKWDKVANAESYNVEYASNKYYFGASDQTQTLSVEKNRAEITGLETGQTWFFRVQAVNAQGESGWCELANVTLGKKPAAPTTWASTTTGIVGEMITLYWTHNSEDNSSETCAEVQLKQTIDGTTRTEEVQNRVNEDEKDVTSSIAIDTSGYTEGEKILWKVRTKGITDKYSDWSVQREIDIYAKPTLIINVSDSTGTMDGLMRSFPINITTTAGPTTQKPVEYAIVISANQSYKTVSYTGEETWVNKNEEIYSKVFDDPSYNFEISLNPGDVNLENDISYTLSVTVAMDSGLTAESKQKFTASSLDDQYEPNAEITIDPDTVSAYIRPYCTDEDGNLIDDVLLAVYRREFDGGLTELAYGLANKSAYVNDPHPALNYARYRIVAISKTTGNVSFYDIPNYPVGEDAVIIQWDESWSEFNSEDETEDVPWTGSLLRLPYNIDISESSSRDVALVEYIGRKHPVDYYGTQVGETSVWNVDVPENDDETIYALRRLSVWMGSVYVREPSGLGYWANVDVSFNRKHCELAIPVTLNVTRVEGGA